MDFEGDDWTASAGSIQRVSAANSGFSALEYSGGGYAELESRPLGHPQILYA